MLHEAGEGILEVFRLGEHDLLAPIVSYADEPDLETMARDAVSASWMRVGEFRAMWWDVVKRSRFARETARSLAVRAAG